MLPQISLEKSIEAIYDGPYESVSQIDTPLIKLGYKQNANPFF